MTSLAVVGGMLLTGLRDVTSDLSALDSSGTWAVVVPFVGEPVCARFDIVRDARPWPGPRWQGPAAASWVSSMSRDEFENGVRTIRELIAAGSVYQVNLCRVLSAPAPVDADVAALGAALAEGNPAPYSAVVRLPGHDVHVASASPELYLARRGDAVESRPIKGTAAEPDGFLPKDRAENVMIVDLVRNDLGRVCEWGSVQVPALCAVEPHPGLFHLVSTVEGRLATPAAAGSTSSTPPSRRGRSPARPSWRPWRSSPNSSPSARGPYCGAIGWVDADRNCGELNVGIRTFWLADGQIHFGTGGGITWDSTPEGEWEETELKARRLLAVASA